MKYFVFSLVLIAVVIIFFVFLGPVYIVEEGEQAVIIRFGEIINVVTNAGLHFKVPVVDQVIRYSKRLLSWDGDARRMPTAENQFIWIDTTARWRISDPRLFYQSVTTMERAYSRLDDIIESAVRTEVSRNNLSEAVRDSNLINKIDRTQTIAETEETEDVRLQEITNLLTVVETQPEITTGRRRLSQQMFSRLIDIAADLGITVQDIVIRQIRYSDDLTESVFNRMVSERRQIAEAYRSYGEGRKQELLGQMENDRRNILSGAYERGQTIRGTADAEAARIYSAAYSRDPEFFEFWRAIESYRRTLPEFRKTLSTDMQYFDYLYNENG